MVDLEQMLDLATPWCLRVAATLRIPEHIAAGHAGIADLAAAAGCDADALHAILGHAARLRPYRPARLPAGLRPALLGGPGRPPGDRGGFRRAHGTGRARRP